MVVGCGVLHILEIRRGLASIVVRRIPFSRVALAQRRTEGVPSVGSQRIFHPRFLIAEAFGMQQFATALHHEVLTLIGRVNAAKVDALIGFRCCQKRIFDVGRCRALAFITDEVEELVVGARIVGLIELRSCLFGRHDDTGVKHRHIALRRTVVGIGGIARLRISVEMQVLEVGALPVGIVRPVGVSGCSRPFLVFRNDDEVNEHIAVTHR